MDANIEPDLERSLRRARWAMRAFRLIFYPAAAVLAFLLLAGSREPQGTLVGETQQGREFVMQLDGGRPIWFETSLEGKCRNGHRYTQHWASTQALAVRDGVLDVEQTAPSRWSGGATGLLTMRLRARVDDGAATGTLWLTDQLGAYVCESGPVTFSSS